MSADRWKNALRTAKTVCVRCGVQVVFPGGGNKKRCVECEHIHRLERKRAYRKKAKEAEQVT